MLKEERVRKAWANEAAGDAQGTEGGCDGWSPDGGGVLVGVGTAPHLVYHAKGQLESTNDVDEEGHGYLSVCKS